MQRTRPHAVPLAFIVLLLSGSTLGERARTGYSLPTEPRQGVAVIIAGAGARFPQAAALLEELQARGLLDDIVFISGDSSGALNAIALNGVLDGRMSWDEYREILSGLTNSDIYRQEGSRLPVDASPARRMYERIVEEGCGYVAMRDLPIPTSLSIARFTWLGLGSESYRMASLKINEESDPSLAIVDVMLASSAFPIVFPAVKIPCATTIPGAGYVDGGIGDDFLPYEAVRDFERFRGRGVEKVYIVGRKDDEDTNLEGQLALLGKEGSFVYRALGALAFGIGAHRAVSRIEEYARNAPELAERTWVWKPEFEGDFLLFDFGSSREQYRRASEWARTHDPVPFREFREALTARGR